MELKTNTLLSLSCCELVEGAKFFLCKLNITHLFIQTATVTNRYLKKNQRTVAELIVNDAISYYSITQEIF